jgi:hypothetical protein
VGIDQPRAYGGIRLPQRPDAGDVVSTKATRFTRRTGRIFTPRMLNFSGQPLGTQNCKSILDSAARAIKISQNEMPVCRAAMCIRDCVACLAGGNAAACTGFAVDQNGIRPCPSTIEF